MLTVKCGCGCETKAQAPDGVTAPVQYGPRIMGAGIYLWHGQFLSRDRACQALSDMFGCAPSPGALAAAARKTAGFLAPALVRAITRHLISAGSRPLRRDRVPHRREARLGPLRLGGEVRAVHRARQARQGRDEGRRGPAALRRDRRPRRLGTLRHLRQRRRPRTVRSARAARAGRGHRDRHGPRQDLGTAGHRRAPRPERGRRAPPAPQARPPSTRKPARSTRTGTARPRRPGSPSTPPARASSSRNGTPSPRG